MIAESSHGASFRRFSQVERKPCYRPRDGSMGSHRRSAYPKDRFHSRTTICVNVSMFTRICRVGEMLSG